MCVQVKFRMKNFEKSSAGNEKGNYKQAFAYFATLAEKDDWESMYNEVTKLYKEEATVAKRGEEAIFWLENVLRIAKTAGIFR